MKNYRYMGYDFRATDATCAHNLRPLYEIDDLKPAGTRPFLTSISEVKEFIRNAVDLGYYLDGSGRTHTVRRAAGEEA